MRNGQEKRRRRRRRRRKEKKINLLLFWTDIEKKIIYITSWIPFVLLTQKSKKHKKFPFCRDVHLSMNQLLKAFYPSAGWFILVGREKKKTKTDGNMWWHSIIIIIVLRRYNWLTGNLFYLEIVIQSTLSILYWWPHARNWRQTPANALVFYKDERPLPFTYATWTHSLHLFLGQIHNLL